MAGHLIVKSNFILKSIHVTAVIVVISVAIFTTTKTIIIINIIGNIMIITIAITASIIITNITI